MADFLRSIKTKSYPFHIKPYPFNKRYFLFALPFIILLTLVALFIFQQKSNNETNPDQEAANIDLNSNIESVKSPIITNGTILSAAEIKIESPEISELGTYNWYGTVNRIVDGDTIEVDWNKRYNEGTDKNRIRIVGVDTNETSANECLAIEAKEALSKMIPVGTTVRLEARHLDSETLDRPLRHIYYGENFETNVATKLIEAGLGLPIGVNAEPDYKEQYYHAGENAMIKGIGLWENGACGDISQEPEIQTHVNFNAAGNDSQNINDEYLQINNTGQSNLDLTGWSFRSSARLGEHTKRFVDNTIVQPGNKLRVHVGQGADSETDIYLGLDNPWFNNENDVLYLRDEYLNMRGAQFWPCTSTCERATGLSIEEVQFDAPGNDLKNPNGEWLKIANTSNSDIDLTDWRIKDNQSDYTFKEGEILEPKQNLIIYIGEGQDFQNVRYWGNETGILSNTSGKQKLEIWSPRSTIVDCYSWGQTRCNNPT